MTCETIMMRDPEAAHLDDPVPSAVQKMLDFGIRNLPVVDDQGRFLGSFRAVHLIQLLLPPIATMDTGFGDMVDLSFIHDSLDDIKDRLDDVRSHRVGDYMETEEVVTVNPDTSIIEAMFLLYKHRTHVPVVEKGTNKLVGVVSFNCILRAITGSD